ncbi:MAG TPA: imidazoleglycerol-phosphate dehydratase [Gemmatimonadaceae bacterium]|nr:imidazoleglycerol-phosphate dehydratase [Gemmatimonadaceae bacterium]
MSVVDRETSETRVHLEIARGEGKATVGTGLRFLDHMMTTLARYSRLDITVQATGDLKHHLIEDVGIAFGAALADFTPPTCARYGHRVVPMDDALVEAAIDLGGRPYYRGPIPSSLYDHWFRSFTDHARATVHVRVLRGRDRHHVVEAAFKALGMSLHDALIDSGVVFSTKGAVRW